MARFTTAPPEPLPPPAGVHVCKIVEAKERTSQNGNAVLAMRLRFPGGEELSPLITFAESTRKIVGYFARSAGLILPTEPDVECEILPGDVLNRYLFVEVVYDDGTPRVARYLSRDEALAVNPRLVEIRVQPQEPRILKPLGGEAL